MKLARIGILMTGKLPIPSGSLAWFRADLGVDEVAGVISQWNDRSGNANHAAQATGAKQPAYITNELNGKPVVRFDGVNDVLIAPSVPFGVVNTIFLVGKTTDTGVNSTYTGGPAYNLDIQSDTIQIETGSVIVGSYVKENSWDVFTCVRKSGDSDAYVNNVFDENSSAVLSDIGTGAFYIGSRFGEDVHNHVDIAEIIIYGRELDATEIDQVNTYLMSKYGL